MVCNNFKNEKEVLNFQHKYLFGCIHHLFQIRYITMPYTAKKKNLNNKRWIGCRFIIYNNVVWTLNDFDIYYDIDKDNYIYYEGTFFFFKFWSKYHNLIAVLQWLLYWKYIVVTILYCYRVKV